MNGSNNKTTRIVIILLAIVCVAVMVIFGLSLTGEESPSNENSQLTLPNTSVSQSDIAA